MHHEVYESTAMGRALVKWAEPYPIDFELGELRGEDVKEMPALITVKDGRLVLNIQFNRGDPNASTPRDATSGTMRTQSLPFVAAHDIGHFLAAPLTDLLKPNIGLPLTNDEIEDKGGLGKGMPLTVYEEEAIAYQIVLLRHLDTGSFNEEGLRRSVGFVFKGDMGNVDKGLEEIDYARLMATLEERLAYIKPEPVEEVSLEDGLAALLGL